MAGSLFGTSTYRGVNRSSVPTTAVGASARGSSGGVVGIPGFGSQPAPTTSYGSQPVPGPDAPGDFVNSVPYNPSGASILEEYQRRLREQAARAATLTGRVDERLSEDTTQRDIDRATSSIADAAAGQKSALRTEQARRGTLGTGTGDMGTSRITEAARRSAAGAAADITTARSRAKDALVLGANADETARNNAANAAWMNAFGGAQGMDRLGLDFANQGLNQYATVRGLDLREQEQQQQQYAQWLAMLRSFS